MNVLLCESHYRSRSWIAALKNYNNLYLLSVMPEEYKIHIEKSFAKKKICNLTPLAIQQSFKSVSFKKKIDYLKKFEKKYKISLNFLVLMDRTLRNKPYTLTIDYIYKIINKEINFLVKKNIQLIFMEPTWFHELILCEIAKVKNIPVFSPVRDKLLTDKFYFFTGYERNDFFLRKHKQLNLKQLNVGDDYPRETPFFNYFSKRNKLSFNKLFIFFRILRLSILNYRNPYIQPTFLWSIKTKFKDILRRAIFQYILPFYEPQPNDKFILIPLHVQPEAGIDVIGEKFSNQLEFIRQICRTTPAEIIIYVKEHPHDFGRRKLEFYNELSKIPCVKLIHPSVSNKRLLESAQLVISVAGTSSLEAALIKKPAVTAVKSHFHFLMVQPTFDPFVDRVSELLDKAKKFKVSDSQIKKFYQNTKTNLFDGNTIDCKTDPSVLHKQNLIKLKNAFLEVIECLKNKNV